MQAKIIAFRNSCAEDGIELTPQEAEKMYNAYLALREEIVNAARQYPGFYEDVCNRTLEEKLEDMKQIEKREGRPISLKEYNDLQEMIKRVCEMEGYT